MVGMGYQQINADHTVFFRQQGGHTTMLVVYVDDMIITSRGAEGIVISQRKYALDLLTETGMLGCKPAVSLIDQKFKLSAEAGEPVDRERYQRLKVHIRILHVHRRQLSLLEKQEAVVARSTAEYRAMALGVAEMLWLRALLHDRTKQHVEIDRFFIKEKLNNGLLKLSHVATGKRLPHQGT
ncbi:uncharacterized protein LOC144567110 [Carex rostrata]